MQAARGRKDSRRFVYERPAKPQGGRLINEILQGCCHIPESRGTTHDKPSAMPEIIFVTVQMALLGDI